jgi:protease I
MTNRTLSGKRVAILLGDNFEQVKMTEPRKALEGAGAQTTLVSPHQGEIHGVRHDHELQDSFHVELPLDRDNPEDFDALLMPGGALNADSMRMAAEVQEFIRSMRQTRKPLAVICHAPRELVSAGVVKGRTLTSYYTIQDDIRNAGGGSLGPDRFAGTRLRRHGGFEATIHPRPLKWRVRTGGGRGMFAMEQDLVPR